MLAVQRRILTMTELAKPEHHLYEQVIHKVKQWIEAQTYQPDDKLPSVRKMSHIVSVMTGPPKLMPRVVRGFRKIDT